MEHHQNQETPCSLPVIARLDRLNRLIQLLEEKRSLSRRDLCAVESKNECKTLSSALAEVQHKGTLVERLTVLEKRVLELSLEIDEGNTSRSRSSSSTVQDSEKIGKNDYELKKDENGDTINKQQREKDPSVIQAQEKASPADRVVKEITASHRSKRQKTKSQMKWSWLFRHTC